MSDVPHPPTAAPTVTAVPRRTAERPMQPPRSVIERFRATKTWTRIVAVTSLTFSGLMLAGGLLLLVRALMARGQLLLVGMAAGLAMIAVIYALPAIALMRYSRSMETAVRSPSITSIENALRQHKTFWIVTVSIAMLGLAVQIYQISSTIFMPNLRDAMGRAKQKRTVVDIKTVGDALEAYAKDHQSYPAARTISDLRPVLVPRYAATLPVKDGWGNDLSYDTRCADGTCSDAAVISAGADGFRQRLHPDQVFGDVALPEEGAEEPQWPRQLQTDEEKDKEKDKRSRESIREREAKSRERDIIWANGRMIQPKPEVKR